MNRLLAKLPNWLRAGVVTATFVALPGFIGAVTSWSELFFAWLAGDQAAFPDLSALRSAAVTLGAAVVAGGLNAAYRWAQERAGRGRPPVYPSQYRGA